MISPISDILDDVANGRMIILVDDEQRENEGDLYIPASFVTPEHINFMAMNGRGLICLPMAPDLCDALGLEPMTRQNTSKNKTAFTVSIEAKEGISTGISAYDRCHTIRVAIDPKTRPDDLASPGHVFPLRAAAGGVLERQGHTEAAVDLARLCGLTCAGVICEVMRDDGHMARLPDLVDFARRHGLKIGAIADLAEFRLKAEKAAMPRAAAE